MPENIKAIVISVLSVTRLFVAFIATTYKQRVVLSRLIEHIVTFKFFVL
jgi:hypothetical protein